MAPAQDRAGPNKAASTAGEERVDLQEEETNRKGRMKRISHQLLGMVKEAKLSQPEESS